jgi:hypothetical protein
MMIMMYDLDDHSSSGLGRTHAGFTVSLRAYLTHSDGGGADNGARLEVTASCNAGGRWSSLPSHQWVWLQVLCTGHLQHQ